MSQAGRFSSGTPVTPSVLTLTGNAGGAVSPDGGGNIDVVGSGTISVTGNPGTNTLTITGGAGGPATYVNTTPYVVLPDDTLLDVDSSGGPITIQLPDVPTDGQSVIIKDLGNAQTNNITVTTVSGGTAIDAGPTYVISTQYQSIQTTGNSLGYYDVSLGYSPISAGGVTYQADIGSTTEIGGAISFSAQALPAGQSVEFRITNPGEIDLSFTDGNHNTLLGGGGSGGRPNNASENTGVGYSSLGNLYNSTNNSAFGYNSLTTIDTGDLGPAAGSFNAGFGDSTLVNLLNGAYNTALGSASASNYTTNESNNICINNTGIVAESNTLRIGSGTGTGTQQLNASYICGIDGVDLSTPEVVTMANDQLGSTVLTAGSGVTITPGAGIITIAAPGAAATVLIGDGGSTATGPNINLVTGYATGPLQNGTAQFGMDNASTATLVFNDSNANLGLGNASLQSVVSLGSTFNNTALGVNSGLLITGSGNTVIGSNVGTSMTTTANNCIYGFSAASNLVSGASNLILGATSGDNLTGAESSNIYLNSPGVTSESTTLRIGSATGTGTQNLNKSFICGIQGITVTGTPVLISSSDQLGIAVSSKRFKNDIENMEDASRVIYKLRPVTFTWNQNSASGLSNASQETQYGLIAEEVARVLPQIVSFEKNGAPLSVNYGELISLLLNEIQRLKADYDHIEERIQELEDNR
jgi:trimeric autotransporter adhesin